MRSVALWVHIISTVGWLILIAITVLILIMDGGTSDARQRLTSRAKVLSKLMPWTWGCILIALATGSYMIIGLSEFSAISMSVIIMTSAGVLMTGMFKFLHAAPWQHLDRGIREEKWEVAEFAMGTIRGLMVASFGFGLIALVSALYR